MGWSHPEISLEDLMKLIKGFVDILILTSGFQSSGRHVHWDPINITRAFQWALFFENVLNNLSHLDVYEESMNELDSALMEIKSSDFFPQGLKHFSASALAKARVFLVEHFVDTLPLKDSHLRAFMTAIIEIDLNELSGREGDRLSLYMKNLNLGKTSTFWVQSKSPEVSLVMESLGESLTKYTIEKFVKRWYSVSDISSIDKTLLTVSEKIRSSSRSEFDDSLFKEQLKKTDTPVVVEQLVGFVAWNRWKSKSLCYFLDKRAIQMVSGADMIFSAPKTQWAQVLKRLNNAAEASNVDLRDTVELLLLGCITNHWVNLIEYLMSVSYNPITISEQYHQVFMLQPSGIESKEETMSSKESNILEFLTALLGDQLDPLWNISPVLAAISIPSWSSLFRLYLSELEILIRGGSSKMSQSLSIEMKMPRRSWRVEFFNNRKRLEESGSGVPLVGVPRRGSVGCFCSHAPYILRKLVWKLRSQCKRASRERRVNSRYSYDLRSYALNFEDGSFL